ncbi:MAG: LPS assembly lipoprotein LptE [Planctomycetaceae bacterium]|nr:LPS assembly lipoprotein LptE [Planctomycetaceae bacterium]
MNRIVCVFVVMLLLVCSGCLGLRYQVGTKTLFGQDVETVYVSMFKTDGIRRDFGERLTEAVCKRIEARSPYKVVGKAGADSILEGEIVKYTKRTKITAPTDDPRQLAMNLSVNVRWKDRRDRTIREIDDIPLDLSWNDADGMINATVLLTPEFGQSETTAEQRLIDTIADQIVGMMEMPW